jgi:hypothetical protein
MVSPASGCSALFLRPDEIICSFAQQMQVFNSEVATCHCLFRSLAVCSESRRVNQTVVFVGFPIWNCPKTDIIFSRCCTQPNLSAQPDRDLNTIVKFVFVTIYYSSITIQITETELAYSILFSTKLLHPQNRCHDPQKYDASPRRLSRNHLDIQCQTHLSLISNFNLQFVVFVFECAERPASRAPDRAIARLGVLVEAVVTCLIS